MDAQAWQDIQDRIECAEAIIAIHKGLTRVCAGRGVDAMAFFDEQGTGAT
ncbi:MAG: hypothetical protein HQL44_14560 [Alphaproteobacteria bacterium]|nr:hypothetical protein [Alphaproteobacteria bacterium]